jgi:hypothetical protein
MRASLLKDREGRLHRGLPSSEHEDGGKLKRERSTTMSDEQNTPQEGEDKDEVEGHLLNQTSADQTTVDKPDVEGHMYNPDQTTVDQTTVD